MEQHKATRPANRRPERNPDPCPLYRKCGGCQLQNLSYPQQLVWKQNQTERLLGKFGKVEPILGMEHPYHYRNKVQAAFGQTRDKKIISGVYQSSTHRIVPVDHCMIEDETADAIIVTVRELMKPFRMQPYNEHRYGVAAPPAGQAGIRKRTGDGGVRGG